MSRKLLTDFPFSFPSVLVIAFGAAYKIHNISCGAREVAFANNGISTVSQQTSKESPGLNDCTCSTASMNIDVRAGTFRVTEVTPLLRYQQSGYR